MLASFNSNGGLQVIDQIISTDQVLESFTNLSAGNYAVFVTDANLCVIENTFILNDPTNDCEVDCVTDCGGTHHSRHRRRHHEDHGTSYE